MKEYDYQPKLTKKLDALNSDDFNREALYEIILWKLNRFPQIDDELLVKIQTLSKLKPKAHRSSKETLKELLACHGIRLPMASTILRFINPSTFQIIDDRVVRVLCEESKEGKQEKIPIKPQKMNDRYLERSCDVYFGYLDKLHKISDSSLPFEGADRILYLLDIKKGNKIGD